MIVVLYSALDAAWARRLRTHLNAPEVHYLEVESSLSTLGAETGVAIMLLSPALLAWQAEISARLASSSFEVIPLPVGRLEQLDEEAADRVLAFAAERAQATAASREWPEPDPIVEAPSRPGELLIESLDSECPSSPEPFLSPRRPLKNRRRKRGPVHLGAAAPRNVKPEREFTVRFVAYHPELERAVKRRLRAGGLQPHFGLGATSWKVGTPVTVAVSGDGLDISPDRQRFVWSGQEHFLEFDIRARARSGRYDTRLRFDVSIAGIVLARLRLELTVSAPRRAQKPSSGRWQSAFAVAPRTAFASYASKDRPRVLDRVAAIRIAAGMDVFLDCLSLHPNDAWRARLEAEIFQREAFMLFWSERARRSPWVEWEWRHALKCKGLDAIQAHPLDPWPKAPLPQELSALHMGDPLMAVREASLKAG